MVDERSAGAVVFYSETGHDDPEYLLLHYTAGHWDFPKGNIETGESEQQTAAREIREETGIADVRFIDGFRMKIHYRYKRGRRLVQKEVVYFLSQTKTRHIVLSDEHIGFAWKKYESAMEQLTYQNARSLLVAARQHLQRFTSE